MNNVLRITHDAPMTRQEVINELRDKIASVNEAEMLGLFLEPAHAERMRERLREEAEAKLGDRISYVDYERCLPPAVVADDGV